MVCGSADDSRSPLLLCDGLHGGTQSLQQSVSQLQSLQPAAKNGGIETVPKRNGGIETVLGIGRLVRAPSWTEFRIIFAVCICSFVEND